MERLQSNPNLKLMVTLTTWCRHRMTNDDTKVEEVKLIWVFLWESSIKILLFYSCLFASAVWGAVRVGSLSLFGCSIFLAKNVQFNLGTTFFGLGIASVGGRKFSFYDTYHNYLSLVVCGSFVRDSNKEKDSVQLSRSGNIKWKRERERVSEAFAFASRVFVFPWA